VFRRVDGKRITTRWTWIATLTAVLLLTATSGGAQDGGSLESPPDTSGGACLSDLHPGRWVDQDREGLLQNLHRAQSCKITEDQRGLQAALWSSIGGLSVGEPTTQQLDHVRGLLFLVADLDDLRDRLESDPGFEDGVSLLFEAEAKIEALQGSRPGLLAGIDTVTARTGVHVVHDAFAITLGLRFADAGINGEWRAGTPLPEGQRIASYQHAAYAYTLAGEYALAAALEGLWVESNGPYQVIMEEIDRIEHESLAHLAAWEPGDLGPLRLGAVFWYGDAVRLDHRLAWSIGHLDGFGEPRTTEIQALQQEFSAAKSQAGGIVLQIFLIILSATLLVSLLVVWAQNRWAKDFQESGLGGELIWRNQE
jgi:hypothetical protein